MRTFALFTAFCLSATAVFAAKLVEVKEPARIADAFSPKAPLRAINVWATWCVPCVEEISDLGAISTMFGGDLSVVGVSLDDLIPSDRAATKKRVESFLDSKKITYGNIYYSGDGDALADSLRFNGEIPITIIYDRAGHELWRQQGPIDRQKTITEIKKLLRRNR